MCNVQSEYKVQNMATWNEVAPRYHRRWAGMEAGPLASTSRLVDAVAPREGDRVIDVACGTGMVTRSLAERVGDSGLVVGADMSATALRIAQKATLGLPNVSLINADAENLFFGDRFDAVTCQYALFFFPDAPRALRNMRQNLRRSGVLGITVHGHKDRVPFYGSILDAMAEFIPDYVSPGTPALDRYSTPGALAKEVKRAGFRKIRVTNHTFQYSPGGFERYWRDYLRYVAKPIREKIGALARSKRAALRESVRRNVSPYTDENGTILFPWQVLILTAQR